MSKLTVQQINLMKFQDLIEAEEVRTRFIENYNLIHKRGGEEFWEQEKYYLRKVMNDSKDLPKCTTFSIYGCLMDIAIKGISIDPESRMAYLEKRGFKIGKDQQNRDTYEDRALLKYTPYGELALRISAGHIKYADNPEIVYEDDKFEIGLNAKGEKVIEYQKNMKSSSKKIKGSFIRLVRPDGSTDFKYLLQRDIDRLQKYSERNNSRGQQGGSANALYSSNDGGIDSGFLEAKTIRHAFKAYPKIKLGAFSMLQTDEIEGNEIHAGQHAIPGYGVSIEDIDKGTAKTEESFDNHQEPEPPVIVIKNIEAENEGF